MRNMLTKIAVVTASIALTAGTTFLAAPVHATIPQGDMPHAVVQIAGLDLQSEAGRATAERRIRSAVDQVCRTGVGHELASAGCRRMARESALRALAIQIAAR
jgi:UrcA family protein